MSKQQNANQKNDGNTAKIIVNESDILSHQRLKDRAKEQLLDIMARMEATEQRSVRCGFSKLYFVPSGWETQWLADDPRVEKVDSLSQLDECLSEPTIHTILLPKAARLQEKMVIRCCERHGLPKTIFMEV